MIKCFDYRISVAVKGGIIMIFGLPVQSFLAFCIWPVVYITIAIIAYFLMAKNDRVTDDSEFGAPNDDVGGADK